MLPNVAPSNVYPTASGEMILIAANQDTVFARLAKTWAGPELSEDPRYAGHAARGRNMAELDEIISAWSAGIETAELLETLHENGVPAGRIYTAKDMFEDPHFAARDAIVRLLTPTSANCRCTTRSPSSARPPAPCGARARSSASTTRRSTAASWA